MRSTRRSEAFAGLVALGLLAAGAAATVAILPPAPDGPRYAGAGHAQPQRGGTFIFHHESDLDGLDPLSQYNEIATMGIKLVFEGLIDYDAETLELVPRLAERLPEQSPDGLTWRFRLREGIRFQDSEVFPGGRGREIVASDVEWSLEHMLSPEVGSPGAPFFSLIAGLAEYQAGHAPHISGIRVIDRRTVDITLSRPDQTFRFAMAMTFAYPVAHEAYEHWGMEEVRRHPVATGAYMLERWEPGVQVVFRRNPSFFEPGRPYVDRMVYQLNLQRGAAVMRFRNGELDHIHRMTPADYLMLRGMHRWDPYRMVHAKVNIWGVTMNCEMAPFDNVHVRRAVAFAINRNLWRRARANRLILTGQPIPSSLAGYDPNLPGQHVYDLRRAREEMRLAGHPNGLREPVEIWIGEGGAGRQYGELVQQDLRAIGIDVQLRAAAFPIYLSETGKPGTAQMLLGGWDMDFPDPASFLDVLFHSHSIHERDSENRSFYRNPQIDSLLDRARVERDSAQRAALYREASRILVADAPWAFIWSDSVMEVRQPYVQNYVPHPVWANMYRDVWLDLPLHRIASLGVPGPRFAAFTPLGALR